MTNLIVNYLPQSMSQDEIKSLFGSIGEMESCKLIKDKITGQSFGYAFVNYRSFTDALKALENMNGLRLQNKRIKVSIARPSSSLIKGANLYVGGIPRSMSELDLQKMFIPCGHIITLRILIDPKTEKSRGVGFVRFDTCVEANRAIKELNGLLLAGSSEPLVVKFANHPNVDNTEEGINVPSPVVKSIGYSLLVENLSQDIDEVDLWQLFGPYGAIRAVQMLDSSFEAEELYTTNPLASSPTDFTLHKFQRLHQNSNSVKRFAIVTMCDYNNAVLAISELNGFCMRGSTLHVSFKRDQNIINGYNDVMLAYSSPTKCLNNQVDELNNSSDYFYNGGIGSCNNGNVCYNSGRSNSSNGSVHNVNIPSTNYISANGKLVGGCHASVGFQSNNAASFYGFNNFQETSNLYNNIHMME